MPSREATRWILARDFERFYVLDLKATATPQEHMGALEQNTPTDECGTNSLF